MKSFKRFVQEEIALPNRKFVKIPTNVLGQNNDITKDIFDMIDSQLISPDNHIGAADVDIPSVYLGKSKAGNFKLTGADPMADQPQPSRLLKTRGTMGGE